MTKDVRHLCRGAVTGWVRDELSQHPVGPAEQASPQAGPNSQRAAAVADLRAGQCAITRQALVQQPCTTDLRPGLT